jgi:antitoxin (DNA-binding transcriptional repressor) of toxin-antitoxin stability system
LTGTKGEPRVPVVKTVSIQELHEQTGRIVREARIEEVVVLEHGRPVIVLKPIVDDPKRLAYWRLREQKLGILPALDVDSTDLIAWDREVR